MLHISIALSFCLTTNPSSAEAATNPTQTPNASQPQPAMPVENPPAPQTAQSDQPAQPANPATANPEVPSSSQPNLPAPNVLAPPPAEPPSQSTGPVHPDPYGAQPGPRSVLTPQPRRGMMIAGWSVFGGAYLLSALVGAEVHDNADLSYSVVDDETVDERARRRNYGLRMLVPVAGPFLALGKVDSAFGGLATALLGVTQVTGAVIGTIGTLRYVKAKQARERVLSGGVSLRDGGGMLHLSGRF